MPDDITRSPAVTEPLYENPFQLDYDRLYAIAERQSEAYANAAPFPHAVIDDFFARQTYHAVKSAFPPGDSDIWKTPTNAHTIGKSVTRQGSLGLKESLFSELQRRLFMELSSSLFLKFMEDLTGISGLIADPYFAEGSFAMSRSGGLLDVHADFSHHDKLGLERRVNMLIYLNDEWSPDYGGALNLYDRNLEIMHEIDPIGNRVAIFTTSESSFHGFPDPIRCPRDVTRKSVNLYYYTAPRPERERQRILFPSDPEFCPIPTRD